MSAKPIRPICNGGLITTVELIAATTAAILLSATVIWEATHHFVTPYQDEIFDQLRFIRALPHLGSLAAYLISGHNEHRIFTTRILFIIDDYFFHGRAWTQIIVCNMIQVISAAMAYVAVVKFDRTIGNFRLADHLFLISAILLLFINPNFFYTLIVPFQVQHAIIAFLVVTAAMVVGHASESRYTTRVRWRIVGILVGLAVVGTFTLGNAPVILIAAATAAIVLRWRFSLAATLCVLAVAHTIITLATTTSVGSPSYNFISILKFALLYWGSPFLRFEAWPAGYVTWWSSAYLVAAFGAVVPTSGVGFALLRMFKPGFGGRLGVFGFVIIVAVIVTGLAAGHSRTQFGLLEAANRKYASFSALGWFGAAAIGMGATRTVWPKLPRVELVIPGLFLAIVLPLTASGYFRETRIWGTMIDMDREAGLAAFLHINDRDKLQYMYTDEHGLADYLAYAEAQKLNIFSDYRFHWGDDANGFLSRLLTTTCRAEVRMLAPLPMSDGFNIFDTRPGLSETMSGWTWMDYDHAPAKTVIAVDSQSRIVGAAATTRTSSRAEAWLGQAFDRKLGWFGFVRLATPSSLTFFALSSDGKAVCPLGSVGNVR